MKIKLKDYRGSKEPLLKFYKKKGFTKIHDFCASTGLPIVVAMCYILEEEPDNKEAQEVKQRMIDFYEYTEIT